MLKSRQELRGMLSRIEAGIVQPHSSNPSEPDFFQWTDGAFHGVRTQCAHEDDDWLFNVIDQICTRQSVPYPAVL